MINCCFDTQNIESLRILKLVAKLSNFSQKDKLKIQNQAWLAATKDGLPARKLRAAIHEDQEDLKNGSQSAGTLESFF